MTEKRKIKRRATRTYLPKSPEAQTAQDAGRALGYRRSLEIRQARARAKLLAKVEAPAVAIPTILARGFRGAGFVRFLDFWPLDDGSSLGKRLEPWQRAFCESATAVGPNGLPRFKRILLSLARQSSKTEVLSAFGCWRTLAVGGATISIATDLDQAKHQQGRLVRALRRNPDLADQFDLSALKGDVLWRADGGAYWRFMPSDEASAGGHVVTTLLCDEVGQFRRGSWSFISQVMPSPAVAAGVAFFSGYKGPIQNRIEGAPLFDLLKQHSEGAADLFVYNVEGRSPASWHTDQFLAEQQAALPDAVFRQLYRNEWSEGVNQFLPLRMIEKAVDATLNKGGWPRAGEAVALGCDLALVKDRAVLSAVAIAGDATVRLIRQRTWQGSGDSPVDLSEIEAVARRTYGDLGACVLVIDPWQGVHVAQRLRAEGLTVEVYNFTAPSVEKMAAGVYELFSRGRVKIPDDPDLREELQGLTAKPTAGGYRWDHPSGGHDDRVVSLALACSGLFAVPEPPRKVQIETWDAVAEFYPAGIVPGLDGIDREIDGPIDDPDLAGFRRMF